MPTWPVTLPASPLVDGFQETPPPTVIRTEMDQGPAKTRQRTTAGVRRMQLSFILSKAQTATLDSFFTDTVKGGALGFDFTHPRTGSTLNCRFAEPPRYAALNGEKFRTALVFEVLP